MPLEQGDKSDTEKEDSKSLEWRSKCYDKDELSKPTMTLCRMKKLLDNTVEGMN